LHPKPPTHLKQQIRQQLDGAQKIAILGIGSDLLSDDAAGLLTAQEIEKRLSASPQIHKPKPSRTPQPKSPTLQSGPEIKTFLGGACPENLTGEITKFKPSHIVMIDAADFKKEPGHTAIIDPKDIDGVSFSTHRLPTSLLIDYLVKSCGAKVIVIGIQPQNLSFNGKVSPAVKSAAKKLAGMLFPEIISS
jgi:hydrogenase 3 maturation protease